MGYLRTEDWLLVIIGLIRYVLPKFTSMFRRRILKISQPANITESSSKMKEYNSLVNSLFDYRTPFELLIARRYPGASFAVFDVHSLMTDMYDNPTDYFTSPANVTGQYTLCNVSGSNCKDSALSLDHFMWFDELHPSEQSDRAIAAEFVKVVGGSSRYAAYW